MKQWAPYVAVVLLGITVAMSTVAAARSRPRKARWGPYLAGLVVMLAGQLLLAFVDRGVWTEVVAIPIRLTVSGALPGLEPAIRAATLLLCVAAWLFPRIKGVVPAACLALALSLLAGIGELALQERAALAGPELSVFAVHSFSHSVGTCLLASSALLAAGVAQRDRAWRLPVVLALWAPCATGAILIGMGEALTDYDSVDPISYISPDNYFRFFESLRAARWAVVALAVVAAALAMRKGAVATKLPAPVVYVVFSLSLVAFGLTRTRSIDAGRPILPAWSTQRSTAPDLPVSPPDELCYRTGMRGFPPIVYVSDKELMLEAERPSEPPQSVELDALVETVIARSPHVATPLLLAFSCTTSDKRQREVVEAIEATGQLRGIAFLRARSLPTHHTSTLGSVERVFPCMTTDRRPLQDTLLRQWCWPCRLAPTGAP